MTGYKDDKKDKDEKKERKGKNLKDENVGE